MTLSIARILLFLLLTTPGLAQQTLTGTVQTGDGQSVAFANVLLFYLPDSALVKGAVADPAGSYTFANLRPGRYRVLASLTGYQTTSSTPFVLTNAGGTRRAEPLVLSTMTNQLGEVRVSAKKPPFEQQIDKLVVNVASMITAGGGSVLDVLERSPGVLVDRQNGSIALGGRDGVMVMLNGKLSRLPLATVVQLLGGMNADNVEKIELMANPSAKYDAEGNAGLINIVLKRNTDEGTNGSLSLMGGYGRYEKANGSVSLNHNRERINWFANGSWNYDNRWFDFEAIRTQPVAGDLWRNYQYSDRYTKNMNADLRLGADLSLGKQTTLSMQVQGLVNNRRATSYNTSNTRLTTQTQPFTQSVLTWLEETPWQNVSGSVGLLHRFGKGQTISVDADYQYYTNRASNRLFVDQLITTQPTTTPLQSVNTSKETDIRFWVVRTDYTRPIGKGWTLESGLKINQSGIDNALGVQRQTDGRFVTDTDQTSTARMDETIGAMYGNLSGKLTPKTNLQAGLRAEATHTTIRTFEGQPILERRYLNLFPSALLKHTVGANRVLTLSFSRRLTRPGYNELTPTFFMTDPNTYYVGNIALRPAYASTIRAGYAYRERYFFWLGYSHERDVINRNQPVVRPGRPELTHIVLNFDRANVWSAEMSFPLVLTSGWSMQNNLAGYYRVADTQFEVAPYHQQVFYGTLNSVHTFRLGRQWTGELSVSYRSLIPVGVVNLRSMTNVIAGVQKLLSNNRGTLRLTISDLLWMNQLRWYVSFPAQQVDFRATLRDAPRIVRLSYTRSFGNQKAKTARQRKGAEDEQKRVTF